MTKDKTPPPCEDDHPRPGALPFGTATIDGAASLLRAMADTGRLELLLHLGGGDRCVSELALAVDADISTVSHRLRVLRNEGLVSRRRTGRHVFYGLADDHVRHLLQTTFDHVTHSHPEEEAP